MRFSHNCCCSRQELLLLLFNPQTLILSLFLSFSLYLFNFIPDETRERENTEFKQIETTQL